MDRRDFLATAGTSAGVAAVGTTAVGGAGTPRGTGVLTAFDAIATDGLLALGVDEPKDPSPIPERDRFDHIPLTSDGYSYEVTGDLNLAGEIRAEANVDVTVDGIEALGLKDGELQVNRSPVKNHLARSTPELIVEKLATADGDDLYGELLDKFDD